MYNILVPTEKSIYELGELAKEFLTIDNFNFVVKGREQDEAFDLIIPDSDNKFVRGKALYEFLSKQLGKEQEWGILVGVRPKKLYSSLTNEFGKEKAEEKLSREYHVSDNKIRLLRNTYETQNKAVTDSKDNAVGLYINIPFCPSRCVYCSFTSNQYKEDKAKLYLKALFKEMEYAENLLKKKGLSVESIYIGGGTPTSISDEEFELLMENTQKYFVSSSLKEFTVECGRPDTINENKLKSVLFHGGNRISINPQSMNQKTLDIIGRKHTVEEILKSYKLARNIGDFIINMDLIAGLPEENVDDFKYTLQNVCDLSPENLTIHTLSVKKASRLIEQDAEYNYKQANTVAEMLKYADSCIYDFGYMPYYLYRQKHQTGNFENVGYCKDGYQSLYNIRIMEENQTILALGAGAISKRFFKNENRLERIPNVSNYEIYIERLDEMIQRKEIGFND